MHEAENNYQQSQNSFSSVMYRAAEANGFRRAITPDNTRPAQECVAHFECMCVCLNAAAGEMFVGDKDSRQSLETSGAAGKILRYSKKVSYLREGGQLDSDM